MIKSWVGETKIKQPVRCCLYGNQRQCFPLCFFRRWLFQRLVNQCLSSSNDSSASADGLQDNSDALLCMDGIDIAVGPDANATAGAVVKDNRAAAAPGTRETGRGYAALLLESSRLLAENLHRELSVCGRAADSFPSNYYAWTHRAWIVRHCFNCSLQVRAVPYCMGGCIDLWFLISK